MAVHHTEFTPQAESRSPPVLPPASRLFTTALGTLPGTCLSSSAPCSQPHFSVPCPDLHCLLLLRLHFLPRTNGTIQISEIGFYWEQGVLIDIPNCTRYLCLVFQVVVLCSSQRRFLFQNVLKYLRMVSKGHGMFCFSQNSQRDLTCQAATRKWFQIRVKTGPVFNRILDSVKSYRGTDQGLGGGAKKKRPGFSCCSLNQSFVQMYLFPLCV